MPTLFMIQDLRVGPIFKCTCTSILYTIIFFFHISSTYSHIKIRMLLSSAFSRAGDAGSGLPSCRTGCV